MKRRGRLLLGAVVGLGLLALFFRGVEWDALVTAFRRARPEYLALSMLMTVVTYTLRAWRWGDLLSPIVRVGFFRLFSATYVGFMSGLLIPRAGEVVRPYLIARRHRIRTSAAFASIIIERLVDLITVLVLFGLYLFVLPLPPQQRSGSLLHVLKIGGVLTSLAALVVLALLVGFHANAERVLAVAERVLCRLPDRFARAIHQALGAFGEGLAVLRAPPGHLLAIGLQSALVWMAIALGIYWNNRAFGLELGFTTTFLILGFLTVGVAVPTPGMVGGFHESYLLALTLGYGVDRDTAAAAGIALHGINSLPVLLLGLALLGGEGLTLGRVAEMTDGNEVQSHGGGVTEMTEGAGTPASSQKHGGRE